MRSHTASMSRRTSSFGEPHHVEAHSHQVLRPVAVDDAALVLRAVELNDQLGLEADEVGDVASFRPLSAEFQAPELPVAQPPP